MHSNDGFEGQPGFGGQLHSQAGHSGQICGQVTEGGLGHCGTPGHGGHCVGGIYGQGLCGGHITGAGVQIIGLGVVGCT